MVDEKRAIILSEGISVQLLDYQGTLQATSKALLGRFTKTNEAGLEHHRKGVFLPDLDVKNGDLILAVATNEHYLVLATMDEIIEDKVASKIAKLLACNTELKVEGISQIADANGNIRKTPVVKVYGLKCHITSITAQLRQYNPGLHPDAQFRIYCPVFDIDLLDKVTMQVNGKSVPLKVMATDYISFSGVVILDVKSETRAI